MRNAELPTLTGMRFYAALLVFLSHATVIPGMEKFSGETLIFNAGVIGVSCFFVLSGFILTYNYSSVFRDGVAAGSYTHFVWDRWTKIYPVHFAMLLYMIPLQVMSPNLPLDWRAVSFHLLMVQCFWPVTNPTFNNYLNVPSWSISCEWFFYLVAPLAIFLVSGKGRRWIPVFIVVVYACGLGLLLSHGQSDFKRLYLVSWFAPSRLPEFLTGVFLGRMFLDDGTRKLAAGSGFMQAAGISLIVAGGMYRAHAPWPLWGGLLYVPGAALLILGLAYGRGFLVAHLSRPFVRRLGTASFCLYLLQAPILRTMKGIWMLRGWEVHSWGGFWAVMGGMFLLVQTVAFIMHEQYELPIQRRLRRLALPRAAMEAQRAETLRTAATG
jgi:peptidoglycan/LPS O-acetylase OafA/YrhL